MGQKFVTYLGIEMIHKEITNRFIESDSVSSDFVELLTFLQQNPSTYDADLFKKFELQEIFTYLKASHQYYLNSWLPKINQTVSDLKRISDSSCITVEILAHFVDNYQHELKQHIQHEEFVLFDFVNDLLNQKYSSAKKDFVINHFLFTHNDNVIVHLNELKTDLLKFEKSLESNFAFHILFNQLEIFQSDLLIHGLIEDDVFIPKILKHINDHFEPLQKL